MEHGTHHSFKKMKWEALIQATIVKNLYIQCLNNLAMNFMANSTGKYVNASAYFILTTDKPMSNKMDVITQQTEQAISIKLKASVPEKKKS